MKVNVNLELKDAIALQYILREMRERVCLTDAYQQLHRANIDALGFKPVFECLSGEYKSAIEVNFSAMDGFVNSVLDKRKQVLQENLKELYCKKGGLVESLANVQAEIVKTHGELESVA